MIRSISSFVTTLLLLLIVTAACGVLTTTTHVVVVEAFTAATTTPIQRVNRIGTIFRSSQRALSSSTDSTNTNTNTNPDRPELPSIPGDFDWDSKYVNDSDWLVGDAVPGKRVMNSMELTSQITALGGLEEKWRKERLQQEYNDGIQIGWVYKAEVTNGRFAMFFLVTGLLTEYWTGISMPGQVEELLRITGVIGM